VVQGAAKEISVTVATEDLVFEEPPAPEKPLLLVVDEYQELLDKMKSEPHFSTAPSDLDEPKPKPKKKAAKKKVAKDADA
jgi:hypothetical protein